MTLRRRKKPEAMSVLPAGKYTGEVCTIAIEGTDGPHLVAVIGGVPDPDARVRWVEQDPHDSENTDGHYEAI